MGGQGGGSARARSKPLEGGGDGDQGLEGDGDHQGKQDHLQASRVIGWRACMQCLGISRPRPATHVEGGVPHAAANDANACLSLKRRIRYGFICHLASVGCLIKISRVGVRSA